MKWGGDMLNKYVKQEIVGQFKAYNDGNVHILELSDGFEFRDKKNKDHIVLLKVYNDKYYVTEHRDDANAVLGKYGVDDFVQKLGNIMDDIVKHMEKWRTD